MKTFNVLYKNQKELQTFIINNKMTTYKNIFIQIFSPSSDNNFIKTLINNISSILPEANVLGVSNTHPISDGKNINETTISFTIFNHTKISTFFIENWMEYSHYSATHIADKVVNDETKLIIALYNCDIGVENFLDAIHQKNGHVIVSGGKISNKSNYDSYLFTNNASSNNGVIFITFENKDLNVYTDYDFNWGIFKKEYSITSCHNNFIQSINNIPAKEFYESFVGEFPDEDIQTSGTEFPLMVVRNSNYSIRPIIGFNNKSIVTTAPVNVGEKIYIGYHNLMEIQKSVNNIFNNIETNPIESLFIYSAKREYYPSINDFPISGINTINEIYNNRDTNILTSQTLTLIGLSENATSKVTIAERAHKNLKSFKNKDLILYKLIRNAADEIYSVNEKLSRKVVETTNELFEQYYIDPLTGLYNSNKFNETIENEKIYALTLLDISSFVSINNFYGSKIGDKILIEFARLLKVYAKKHDCQAFRIYSDIFAIVAKDNSKGPSVYIENMSILQERIHKHCFLHDHYKIFINTTLALTTNSSSIYRLTSMGLEYAKTKNLSFIVYDKELNIEKEIQNNLIWVRKLISAIKNDRIIPYFQPIYNNQEEKYDKFEVLMRMIDEDGKVILPNQILNIAKKAKLYKQLTHIIIDKAFATFENTDYEFSINLSVVDIVNEETRDFIYDKLKNSSCSSNVIFELVESENIENYSQVIDFIANIKSYGAKVAIDDFGTGFSNFQYLFKLNINCIKIDGSIIENIVNDKACELVAETIIGFAKKMNITTIAEYVSKKEIYDKIKQLGIDFSQGYYFSKPIGNISNIIKQNKDI